MQYPAPRDDCPICLDERQYVGWDGQQWTTLAELASAGYRGKIAEEGPGVIGIGTEPAFAIGQRALLITTAAGNVLWDMITYLDDDLIQQVRELGGVSAIAISHPHYYGTMIECAHAFGAVVYIHAADSEWVARPDPVVEFWEGDTLRIGGGLTLINLGVHFSGGQVLHWAGGEGGRGALMSGDIVQVVQDRRWVSFMYSYPNLIPERPAVVRRAHVVAGAATRSSGSTAPGGAGWSRPTARPRSSGRRSVTCGSPARGRVRSLGKQGRKR